MTSAGKWALWARGTVPGCLCPPPSAVRGRAGLWRPSERGDEAAVCETELHGVRPDPGPAREGKPAVPREESWALSYEEGHP